MDEAERGLGRLESGTTEGYVVGKKVSMAGDRESEVKRVATQLGAARLEPKRDLSLTGGERAETRQEKQQRQKRKAEPKEAPIIQKDVT